MKFPCFLAALGCMVLIGFNHNLCAQTIIPVTTKSPSASSIDKFIERPVSYYTGIPEINIPIYEISIKGITIPISLNYNAGGIRVNEAATWVGLGWSLSYGGQVSRSVKGKPDEYTFITKHKGPSTGSNIAFFRTLPGVFEDIYTEFRCLFLQKAKDPHVLENDLRPDEFYYNMPNYSGRYMFDQKNDSFVMFPKSDVKVDLRFAEQNIFNGRVSFRPVDYWTITTPDGISARFGEGFTSRRGLQTFYEPFTIDVWNIRSLRNTANDSITYHYSSSMDTSISRQYLSHYTFPPGTLVGGSATNYNLEHHLERIDFPNGSIHFLVEPKTDKGVRLKEVIVKDMNNNVIKKIVLYHSYFHGVFGNDNIGTQAPYFDYRLRLDSIVYLSENNRNQGYSFDYYFNEFDKKPSRNCLGQDSWGYFNGANNNTLVPFWRLASLGQTVWGDRYVSPDYNQIFTLKSITFPTGGKQIFQYESNTAVIEGPDGILPVVGKQEIALNYAGITVSGNNRLSFGITPDSIGGNPTNPEYYFWKIIEIPQGGSYIPYNSGWNCSTNFYTGSGETWESCYSDNVHFLLEKLETNGTKTSMREHVARNCSYYTYHPEDHKPMMPLEPGIYKMTVLLKYRGTHNVNRSHYTNFSIYWKNNAPVDLGNFMYVGGLRIKNIINYSSDNTIATRRRFSYLNPFTNLISGRIISIPLYFQYGNGMTDPLTGKISSASKVMPNPIEPLQSTGNAYLGYEFVTEELIGLPGDTIKTRYKFLSVMPHRNEHYKNYSWGEIEAQEWKRGKPKEVVHFKNNLPVRKEEYSYFTAEIPYTSSAEESVEEINTDLISAEIARPVYDPPGQDFHDLVIVPFSFLTDVRYHYGPAHVEFPFNWPILPPSSHPQWPYTIQVPDFKRYTGTDKAKSKRTVEYTLNDSIVTEELFYYDKYPQTSQLTRKDFINSKGDTIRDIISYPTDNSLISPYNVMVQKNMINVPVKTTTIKNSVPLKTTEFNYHLWGPDVIAPKSTFLQNGTGTPYITSEAFAYDEKGNVLTMSGSDKGKKSFIYAHQQQYPIAVVANALHSEIAFTSFDAPETGNWTYTDTSRYRTDAITGNQAYTLISGNAIVKTSLPSGKKYIISYWSKNGAVNVNGITGVSGQVKNGWTYWQHVLPETTTTVTVSGSNKVIDELRLHPIDAKMTTQTYLPLVGINSECDVNNRITYYEYDSFGRLKLIRDANKNILKKFCYNYTGQPVNCD